MTIKTILEVPTMGDTMTLPGGVALRVTEGGEFIVHNYNTDRDSGTSRGYFQGSYFNAGSPQNRFMNALTEFTRRCERQSGYDRGGAIDIDKLTGLPLSADYATA